MQPFSYVRPSTVQEAVTAFSHAGAGARYIAGGTTLYDMMKLRIEAPASLIDVTAIEELDKIETHSDVLRFGARALMAEVAANEVVARDYPVLAEALSKAASQQLRNMATVGGNLLQRTRCMYFRNGEGVYPCNKREPGSGCAAIGGLDRGQAVLGTSPACTAVSPGDWPVALTAMGASVEVVGPSGSRMIPINDLYLLPGNSPHLEFGLIPGEMITLITVPKNGSARGSTYHKIRDRWSYAFALTSAAVALEIQGSIIRNARIALGGVATRPWRAAEAERVLNGARLTPETALEAGRAAFAGATAGSHNAYKIELGIQTVSDAILIAAERSRS